MQKQTIFRVSKDKRNPYVMINRTMLNDIRLSWKAKGILSYLLSMPDDWQVYAIEIQKHATDGIDSLSSGIQELINCGYIRRSMKRNDKGHFKGYEYVIREVSTESGLSENGLSENGLSENGKSNTTNTDLTNTDLTNTDSSSSDNPLSISKDLKTLMRLFESGGFGPLNSYVGERISSLMEDYNNDWVEDAMKIAIDSNVRKLTYVESILKRWQAEGKGSQNKKADDPYAGMEMY